MSDKPVVLKVSPFAVDPSKGFRTLFVKPLVRDAYYKCTCGWRGEDFSMPPFEGFPSDIQRLYGEHGEHEHQQSTSA